MYASSFFGLCFILCIETIVHSEVVDDFLSCSQFFYENKPPEGFNGQSLRKICQKRQNNYFFATLYDTKTRIPVYSAGIISRNLGSKCGTDRTWQLEPQLLSKDEQADMMAPTKFDQWERFKETQAIDRDYEKPNSEKYDRGHLLPYAFQNSESCKATNTLTNAVPQVINFNRGLWKKLEGITLQEKRNCGSLFVITGAVSSKNEWISYNKSEPNRVNVPMYLWSAICCQAVNNGYGFAFGFLAENKRYTNEGKDFITVAMSIAQMRVELKKVYGNIDVELFKNDCQQKNDKSKEKVEVINNELKSYTNRKSDVPSNVCVNYPRKRRKIEAQP